MAHDAGLVGDVCLVVVRARPERLAGVGAEVPGRGPRPCLRVVDLVVDRARRQVDEERPVVRRPGADVGERAVGEHIRLVVGGEHSVRMPDVVLLDDVVVHRVRRGVAGREPVVVAGRDLRLGGLGGDAVLVQLLADVRGAVARLLEPDAERVGEVELRVAALGQVVVEHAVVVRVLAAQEGRPRRAAERIRGERVRERRPAIAEQPVRERHRLHVPEPLVVGHDDHHVRLLLGRVGSRGGRRKRERGDREDRARDPDRDRGVEYELSSRAHSAPSQQALADDRAFGPRAVRTPLNAPRRGQASTSSAFGRPWR